MTNGRLIRNGRQLFSFSSIRKKEIQQGKGGGGMAVVAKSIGLAHRPSLSAMCVREMLCGSQSPFLICPATCRKGRTRRRGSPEQVNPHIFNKYGNFFSLQIEECRPIVIRKQSMDQKYKLQKCRDAAQAKKRCVPQIGCRNKIPPNRKMRARNGFSQAPPLRSCTNEARERKCLITPPSLIVCGTVHKRKRPRHSTEEKVFFASSVREFLCVFCVRITLRRKKKSHIETIVQENTKNSSCQTAHKFNFSPLTKCL